MFSISYEEGKMTRRWLCVMLVCILLFISFSHVKTSAATDVNSFYDLYWFLPSNMQVTRMYEEFTFQELMQLEKAAKILNHQEGTYSHTFFSSCGGAVHLHERETGFKYQFYATLRTTSYYFDEEKNKVRHLIFMTAIKNKNND